MSDSELQIANYRWQIEDDGELNIFIDFIEENEVKPNKNKEMFDDVLKESIKCHHNTITFCCLR